MEIFLNSIKTANRINDSLFNRSSYENSYYRNNVKENARSRNPRKPQRLTANSYSLEVSLGPIAVKDVFFSQREIEALLAQPVFTSTASSKNKVGEEREKDDDDEAELRENGAGNFLFSNHLVIRSGISGNLNANPVAFSYWFETLKGANHRIFHPHFYIIPAGTFGYSVSFRFRGFSHPPPYVWSVLKAGSFSWFDTILDSLRTV